MTVKSSQEVIIGILDDGGSDFESLPSLKPLSTNDTILNIGESSLLGALVEKQTLGGDQKLLLGIGEEGCTEKKRKRETKAEAVRRARQERVPPEPSILEEIYLTIAVRHVNKGIITRFFPTNSKVSNVYHWVGSVLIHPIYFKFVGNKTKGRISKRVFQEKKARQIF